MPTTGSTHKAKPKVSFQPKLQSSTTMASLPAEIASTIQSAHINRAPSPHHDVNPSTAAETNIAVETRSRSHSSPPSSPSAIPLQPRRRRPTLPPLPDLRFEQSYLASIPPGASWAKIIYITVRDQVLFPLLQGTLWALAVEGWRHFNRATTLRGTSLGARARRWWWDVNNWKIPPEEPALDESAAAYAQGVKEVGAPG